MKQEIIRIEDSRKINKTNYKTYCISRSRYHVMIAHNGIEVTNTKYVHKVIFYVQTLLTILVVFLLLHFIDQQDSFSVFWFSSTFSSRVQYSTCLVISTSSVVFLRSSSSSYSSLYELERSLFCLLAHLHIFLRRSIYNLPRDLYSYVISCTSSLFIRFACYSQFSVDSSVLLIN